jgi:uncharacterized membrane protein (UPF0127 family)
MWRKDMPQHEGMLFVFEQAAPQCFWMRNTLIPLATAFLADDGTIVNIAEMGQFDLSPVAQGGARACPGSFRCLRREEFSAWGNLAGAER